MQNTDANVVTLGTVKPTHADVDYILMIKIKG